MKMTAVEKQKLPGEAYSDKIRARFWITGNQGAYIGIGRATLLVKIQETGSINAAAKSMKMSYKRAWGLVEEMNHMFSEPLVVKVHGGKSGGGTVLTEKGEHAVRAFFEFESKLKKFLEAESRVLDL